MGASQVYQPGGRRFSDKSGAVQSAELRGKVDFGIITPR
jgi:hypothetical protein